MDLTKFDELGGEGFSVDTPVIKSRKMLIDTEIDMSVKTKDGAGLDMSADNLQALLGGTSGATVNINSFDSNL